jgi:transketolase
MPSEKELSNIASQVRRDIIRMVHGAASGHPGGSLGAADILVSLYFEIMKPSVPGFPPDGGGEDMFFLSNGHLSALWYSVLARYGFFPVHELGTFRKLGSRLQGHPSVHDGLPGIRMASGSLGQGLSVSAGAALAKKLDGDPHLVWCMCGDGELQEGQNWEALMFAAARGIDNLVAIVDYNHQQIDGPVEKIIDLGHLKGKLESFGWQVLFADGNATASVTEVLNKAKAACGNGKPVAVLMHTHMGYGVDFMLDNHEWHGSPPNDEQAGRALEQLKETLGDY